MKNKSTIIGIIMLVVLANGVFGAYMDAVDLRVSLISQDPDPAEPGKYVDVRWKVVNYGSKNAEDVIFELLPKYPFSLDPNEDATKDLLNIWGLQKDEKGVILLYKIRVDDDAVDGLNEIELRYDVNNQGWMTLDKFYIDVEKEEVNFQLGSLETEPTRLVSDTEDAKLSVELQNIGDGKAENVVTKIILPEGFKATYGYSDVSNLGTIDADSSKTSVFYIDVDESVKEGNYEATLEIKYKEENDKDNEYKEESIILMIPVKATPLFDITEVETIPETIKKGDNVDLRLKVKNTGTKKAESVSIKAFKEASQPFEFDEKSDFIGTLNPGEEGEAVLKFTVEKDATAKKYLLDIEIRTINEEDVLVFEKTVPVEVSNHEKKSILHNDTFIGMTITIVIIIIGLVIFSLWKKRKK